MAALIPNDANFHTFLYHISFSLYSQEKKHFRRTFEGNGDGFLSKKRKKLESYECALIFIVRMEVSL